MELLTALLRMLVCLAAEAKLLAVKAATSIGPASLPCWPACLVLIKYFEYGLVEVNLLQTSIYYYILVILSHRHLIKVD